jgi:predicted secreted protein
MDLSDYVFSTSVCQSALRKNFEHKNYRKFEDVVMKGINALNKGYNNKKVFAESADRTAEGNVTS